jgi:hypothetical protein
VTVFHYALGLCNTPANFVQLKESILRDLTHEACLENLDDIVISQMC